MMSFSKACLAVRPGPRLHEDDTLSQWALLTRSIASTRYQMFFRYVMLLSNMSLIEQLVHLSHIAVERLTSRSFELNGPPSAVCISPCRAFAVKFGVTYAYRGL